VRTTKNHIEEELFVRGFFLVEGTQRGKPFIGGKNLCDSRSPGRRPAQGGEVPRKKGRVCRERGGRLLAQKPGEGKEGGKDYLKKERDSSRVSNLPKKGFRMVFRKRKRPGKRNKNRSGCRQEREGNAERCLWQERKKRRTAK